MIRRMRLIFMVFTLTIFLIPTTVMAAGPRLSNPGRIRGVVLTREKSVSIAAQIKAAATLGVDPNLTYNGGPVMHTNKTYAIYWVPSGYSISAKYQPLIDGFFRNVAASNGKKSNVYYATTQYYDTTHGKILYKSSFGGSYLDSNPFPTGDCTDSYTSICLGDDQIQTEIDSVATSMNWSRSGAIFFMFTPSGVGSCASGMCAFSDYCAYHSDFVAAAGDTLYANVPYAMTVPSACDTGVHPNNDDADATINLISHEHNETITDMLGTAWYNYQGNEDGDLCAWDFGNAIGSTSYGLYNQTIGTGKYYIQREWSNRNSHCVLKGY